jgi:hypothetical protein
MPLAEQLDGAKLVKYDPISGLTLAWHGGTNWNRVRLGLPKAHWIDAACVGDSTPNNLLADNIRPLPIRAIGNGNRQMCQTDKYGFPKAHRTNQRVFDGFHTGDMVVVRAPKGKYAGTHVGRVTVRNRPDWKVNGVWFHRRHVEMLQRADGYVYTQDSWEVSRC